MVRPQQSHISIFVVADENIPRQALVHLVRACPNYVVAGEAAVSNAEAETLKARPDVVLLHVGCPRRDILQSISAFTIRDVPVVTLLRNKNAWLIQACHRAGALGLVCIDSRSADLFRAIDAAANRKTYVDAIFGEQVLGNAVRGNIRRPADLSARESEVLKYVAYGYTNAAVAERLGISGKTVETYRARLMVKLKLNDRRELVRFALITGVLSVIDPEKQNPL